MPFLVRAGPRQILLRIGPKIELMDDFQDQLVIVSGSGHHGPLRPLSHIDGRLLVMQLK